MTDESSPALKEKTQCKNLLLGVTDIIQFKSEIAETKQVIQRLKSLQPQQCKTQLHLLFGQIGSLKKQLTATSQPNNELEQAKKRCQTLQTKHDNLNTSYEELKTKHEDLKTEYQSRIFNMKAQNQMKVDNLNTLIQHLSTKIAAQNGAQINQLLAPYMSEITKQIIGQIQGASIQNSQSGPQSTVQSNGQPMRMKGRAVVSIEAAIMLQARFKTNQENLIKSIGQISESKQWCQSKYKKLQQQFSDLQLQLKQNEQTNKVTIAELKKRLLEKDETMAEMQKTIKTLKRAKEALEEQLEQARQLNFFLSLEDNQNASQKDDCEEQNQRSVSREEQEQIKEQIKE